MRLRAAFPVCLLLTAAPLWPQAKHVTVSGYVPHVTPSPSFDLNAFPVLCGAKSAGACSQKVYVGERVEATGQFQFDTRTLSADSVHFGDPAAEEISGSAVIDAPPVLQAPGKLLVRADGYPILLDGQTKIAWTDPVLHLSDVKAGNWIIYEGTRRADGVVTAASAKLSRDAVTVSEENLRRKKEFNPATVSGSQKQGVFSRSIKGIDPKRIPAYRNPAMQDRVQAIGEKLIPAYQRALPDGDPAKIHFRFQVVDSKFLDNALTLPNGIVLVPRLVVERMQNDAQLAAVLADNIACALEKQQFRGQPAARGLAAGSLATEAAGLVVPGLGYAWVGASAIRKAMQIKEEKQSGRVGLELLHDAGYDIDQAPMAWWLLAPEEPTAVTWVPLPRRAAYLYRILGEEWNNPAAPANPWPGR